MTYAPNAVATGITSVCSLKNTQACYHYSSAISNNPRWSTLTCPQEAATNSRRIDGVATATWSSEHRGASWQDAKYRKEKKCDRDEFPPAYFLRTTDDEMTQGGKNRKGQRVRWVPRSENGGGGEMWKGVCFKNPLEAKSLKDFADLAKGGTQKSSVQLPQGKGKRTKVEATIDIRPEFEITYEHSTSGNTPFKDDGLWENPCWPSDIAKSDPGFALLSIDEWYDVNPKPTWDYKAKYEKGKNGD